MPPAAPVVVETSKPVVAVQPVPEAKPVSAPVVETKTVPAAVEPPPVKTVIRINAGSSSALTNSNGEVWMADTGFDGGDSVERTATLQIANTDNPAIYRTEHHSMKGFSMKVPNGKYAVKLHFAETFHGVTGAGERVFSFNVEGQEFNDFDVFKKAGGGNRAYIETVNVDVQDGKLDITFKAGVQNPEINGIEIVSGF
jgi:hypothetical protein